MITRLLGRLRKLLGGLRRDQNDPSQYPCAAKDCNQSADAWREVHTYFGWGTYGTQRVPACDQCAGVGLPHRVPNSAYLNRDEIEVVNGD